LSLDRRLATLDLTPKTAAAKSTEATEAPPIPTTAKAKDFLHPRKLSVGSFLIVSIQKGITAEALRAPSKKFLINKYSDLFELSRLSGEAKLCYLQTSDSWRV
jgi:hypothetical protein